MKQKHYFRNNKQKTLAERKSILEDIRKRLSAGIPAKKACEAHKISIATFYNWKRKDKGEARRGSVIARPKKLSAGKDQMFVAIGTPGAVQKALKSFFASVGR